MNRADRRRAAREAGRKRAPGKKGRRPARRGGIQAEPTFDALRAAGVVLASPRLIVPGQGRPR